MMKKTLSFILFLLSLLVFIFGSYKIVQNYRQDQSLSQNSILFSQLEASTKALHTITDEQALSAVYLGYGGKTDFNRLENARKETDERLKRLQVLAASHTLPDLSRRLGEIGENLQYVRSRIDVVTPEYRNILFDYFQDEIIGSLHKTLKEIIEKIPSYKSELTLYQESIDFMLNLSQEKSYIAFILGRNQAMNAKELQLWEQLLTSYRFPSKKLSAKLGIELFSDPASFAESMRTVRIPVVRSALVGNYLIGATDWVRALNRWSDKLSDFEEQIIRNIEYSSEKKDIFYLQPLLNTLLTFAAFVMMVISLRSLFKREYTKEGFISLEHLKERRARRDAAQKEETATLRAASKTLPLTNIHKEFALDEMDAPYVPKPLQIHTFNPVEAFSFLIDQLIQESHKRKQELAYKIDPSLPESCRGDLQKIVEVVRLPFYYLQQQTSTQNKINIFFDQVARKEEKTAIRITVCDHQSHIPEKDRRLIVRSQFYKRDQHLQYDRSSPFTPLFRLAHLVHLLGGELTIDYNTPHGMAFVAMIDVETPDAE